MISPARLNKFAEKVIGAKRSDPQALKRRHILNDLAARLKSCPSRLVYVVEFAGKGKARWMYRTLMRR